VYVHGNIKSAHVVTIKPRKRQNILYLCMSWTDLCYYSEDRVWGTLCSSTCSSANAVYPFSFVCPVYIKGLECYNMTISYLECLHNKKVSCHSQKLHFSFNSNKFKLLRWPISETKMEYLFSAWNEILIKLPYSWTGYELGQPKNREVIPKVMNTFTVY
jgi:hypothetical protein